MVKIKGSTILEVIIALLLGTIIIGFSMNIVVKTAKNYNAVKKADAMFLVENRFAILKENPELLQDSIWKNGILLVEKLEQYQGSNDLLLLKIEAYTVERRFLLGKKILIEKNDRYED
ncbi:hypothetical protein [Marinifilum fragile]|uniref:hypothetical protein n=1 Tax=Marinifilum fragile TaxID=570161 RepID=UPI002AA82C50|nr:hypothetical protein [Marinifilum fragile]